MSLGFLDHMRVVPDHRIPGMVTYPLDEILLATLAGIVCGADDWDGIEEIATGALDWLRGFLPFAEGVPTAQTFRKVFRLLDAPALQRGFAAWAASMRGAAREVIAVDGKTLRGSKMSSDGRARCIWFRLTPPRPGWCWRSGRSREVERDHGDSQTPGYAQPQGRDRHHRRDGNTEGDRPAHRRQGRRLRARPQRQSDEPARGRRAFLRRPVCDATCAREAESGAGHGRIEERLCRAADAAGSWSAPRVEGPAILR